jgi:hypothetical protein
VTKISGNAGFTRLLAQCTFEQLKNKMPSFSSIHFFIPFAASRFILLKLHNFADHFVKFLKSSKIGW